MEIVILVIAIAFLAYSNGANDNMKGVATLLGSKTVDYKKAITIATVFTLLGSATSMFLAGKLLKSFSGKGLVDAEVAVLPTFIIAVGAAAALTVFLATRFGFPISTTHSLTGALVGGGLMATGVNFGVLWNKFFMPLIVSPVVAVVLTGALYVMFRRIRLKLGVTRDTCICAGGEYRIVEPERPGCGQAMVMEPTQALTARVGSEEECVQRYSGRVVGMNAEKILNACHFFTASAVSFARGLNDTPKIAALLLAAPILSVSTEATLVIVGIAIAVGGIVSARKVAVTMSEKITEMNHGQGFSANLVTAFLVIFASKLGVPVSTTHVSCGALFGLGMVNKKAHWKTIGSILLSWLITLPVAGLLSASLYYLIRP